MMAPAPGHSQESLADVVYPIVSPHSISASDTFMKSCDSYSALAEACMIHKNDDALT